jgi:hypothetical protein
MSDLPEMLRGTIAYEHREMMQAAWLAEKRPCQPDEKTDRHECSARPDFCQTTTQVPEGAACTEGPTCLPKDCGKKTDFHPAVAGWSTPPELHAR